MTRFRIPTWPAGPGVPLISFGVLRLLIPVILVALGIAWYSFTPAPNAVLFCSILVAGWVIGWVVYRLARLGTPQRWRVFRPYPPRHRGRDSRVSALRVLLDEPRRENDEELHRIISAIVSDRLSQRRVHGQAENDPGALLGGELAAYLNAPEGMRRRPIHTIDTMLQRIERL